MALISQGEKMRNLHLIKNINLLIKKVTRHINIMYQFKGIFHLKERRIISKSFHTVKY